MFNIRQANDPVFLLFLTQLADFTGMLITHLREFHHSLTYLFHFWASMAQEMSRYLGSGMNEMRERLGNTLLSLVKQVVNQRLSMVKDTVQDLMDDVLCDMDSLYWEMKSIGKMIRFDMESGGKMLGDMYDDIYRDYNVHSIHYLCRRIR